MAGVIYITFESIWKAKPNLNATLAADLPEEVASTAQEGQPQDYPQQAAHPQQQNVKGQE